MFGDMGGSVLIVMMIMSIIVGFAIFVTVSLRLILGAEPEAMDRQSAGHPAMKPVIRKAA